MPCDCIALIEFNFGDDYLHSSGSFNSLEGRVNGELVGIDLDDSEGNMLRQIVSRYAPDFENQ